MKVALVISGMLRNFNAALLSLHIFGTNVDRYLITWLSAGQSLIDQYTKDANINCSSVFDDSVMNTFDPQFRGNQFRMTYLWSRIYNCVPKIYDKYIIIRPDGFYWTTDINSLNNVIMNTDQLITNTWFDYTSPSQHHSVNDHILIIDKQYLNLLFDIHKSISALMAPRYKRENNPWDIHGLLYDYFINKTNPYSNKLVELVDCIFVRDSFNSSVTDAYSYTLYTKIFHNSAYWYSQQYNSPYEGCLRMNNHS